MSFTRANNRKGNKAELEVKKWLESNGYFVYRTVRHSQIGRSLSNDVFGCDLIAKKVGERTRWVQVTMDRHIGRKKAEHDLVPWDPKFDSVEVWRRTRVQVDGKVTIRYLVYHRDYDYERKQATEVYV